MAAKACDLVENFKVGDLVFGQEKQRELFRSILNSKHKKLDSKFTIDHVNNAIIYQSMNDGELSLRDPALLGPLQEFAKEFFEFLQQEKNSHPKYKNSWDKSLETADEEFLIRSNCQAAIRFVLSDSCTKGTKIHFDIKNLNIKRIIEGVNNKFFTGAELREVIRLIQDNSDKIRKKILFYEDGKSIGHDEFVNMIKKILETTPLEDSPIEKSKHRKVLGKTRYLSRLERYGPKLMTPLRNKRARRESATDLILLLSSPSPIESIKP